MEKNKIRRKTWKNIYILETIRVRKAKSTVGVVPDQAEVPLEPELRMCNP